jgi:hypothetical protein
MRLTVLVVCAACLTCGCASNGTTGGDSAIDVYDDWLYYQQDRYDDDFRVWVDENPDCCDDREEIRDALQEWYDGLDAAEQQEARDRIQDWLDDRGVATAAGQSVRDLVLETASSRWAALRPAERQQWLERRAARVKQRRATGHARPSGRRPRVAIALPSRARSSVRRYARAQAA